MKQRRERSVIRMIAGATLTAPLLFGAPQALAETAAAAGPAAPAAGELEEIVVSGDRLDVMQNRPVDSAFGFDKPVLETPRSMTTINSDLMKKTLINGINDLVALTPGSFTQSFFGVAGSLAIRGTPGENYFRGMKRIDNPGNYPTPIGASDSIDIVRGPASPIFGPSKVGGYLDFHPKSEKADANSTAEPAGEIGFQGGNQVAGWNRLTQQMIDNGTYITGQSPSGKVNKDRVMVLRTASNYTMQPPGMTAASGRPIASARRR